MAFLALNIFFSLHRMRLSLEVWYDFDSGSLIVIDLFCHIILFSVYCIWWGIFFNLVFIFLIVFFCCCCYNIHTLECYVSNETKFRQMFFFLIWMLSIQLIEQLFHCITAFHFKRWEWNQKAYTIKYIKIVSICKLYIPSAGCQSVSQKTIHVIFKTVRCAHYSHQMWMRKKCKWMF